MIKKAIEILFPSTKNVDEVVNIFEKYRHKFGLNTDLRLAMFLAQVREEIGPEFKVLRESLNYHKGALQKVFGKRFTDLQAEAYGRSGGKKANQEAIANLAYGNRLGNGAPDSDGDGDMDSDDDGWKYRGAGCLQITGKANFAEVQKRIVAKTGSEADPDTMEGFLLFGFAYWLWRDCYRAADTGDIDKVTAIINKYTSSYESRKGHYNKIRHLVK